MGYVQYLGVCRSEPVFLDGRAAKSGEEIGVITKEEVMSRINCF